MLSTSILNLINSWIKIFNEIDSIETLSPISLEKILFIKNCLTVFLFLFSIFDNFEKIDSNLLKYSLHLQNSHN